MGFAAYRQAKGLQVSSVKRSLQVLRRVPRMSVEWGALESVPRVKMLPGERHRERVVTLETALPETQMHLASMNCGRGSAK